MCKIILLIWRDYCWWIQRICVLKSNPLHFSNLSLCSFFECYLLFCADPLTLPGTFDSPFNVPVPWINSSCMLLQSAVLEFTDENISYNMKRNSFVSHWNTVFRLFMFVWVEEILIWLGKLGCGLCPRFLCNCVVYQAWFCRGFVRNRVILGEVR